MTFLKNLFVNLSMPKKVFWSIFGLGLIVGLFIGLINLISPGAGNVTLNGENVEGVTALLTSIFASAIPALIFGLLAAGITSIFTRKKKSK